MVELTCDIEGCENLRTHLLWCEEHYLQVASGGGENLKSSCGVYERRLAHWTPRPREKTERVCSVPDCGKPHSARGWCSAHYYRWQCSGDPTIKPRLYVCRYCGRTEEANGTRGRLPKSCPACAPVARAEMQAKYADKKRAWGNTRDISRDARSAPCAGCGKTLWGGKGALPAGERRCLECRRATWTRICAACGVVFHSKVKLTYCSRKCFADTRALSPEERRERRRAKDRRRRARERGAKSEPYTLAEIAERDRYRCGLCGKRVAMTETVPHPKSPTIDHIIPLSKHGDDTPANVWLAHFICNSVKGDRGGGEQLALL